MTGRIQEQPKSSPQAKGGADATGWIARGTVTVPSLCRATGDVLLWADVDFNQLGATHDGAREVSWRPRRRIILGQSDLLAFVNIQSPRDAGRYAEKWGPLRICRAHNVPGSHRMSKTPEAVLRAAVSASPSYCPPIVRRQTRSNVLAALADIDTGRNATPLQQKGRGAVDSQINVRRCGEEPLERWVEYASEFRNLLRGRGHRRRMESQEFDLLRIKLRKWLLVGGVGLSPVVVGHDLQPTIATGGLFGNLAALLFAAMCGGGTLALCSSCAMPFIAARAPAAGRDSYCSSCGRAASSRAATQRWDAKNPGRSHHANR